MLAEPLPGQRIARSPESGCHGLLHGYIFIVGCIARMNHPHDAPANRIIDGPAVGQPERFHFTFGMADSALDEIGNPARQLRQRNDFGRTGQFDHHLPLFIDPYHQIVLLIGHGLDNPDLSAAARGRRQYPRCGTSAATIMQFQKRNTAQNLLHIGHDRHRRRGSA